MKAPDTTEAIMKLLGPLNYPTLKDGSPDARGMIRQVVLANSKALSDAGWVEAPKPEETVEEWRVTGNAGSYGPYEFTWRGENAESEARTFLTKEGVQRSITELQLHHRTVTYSKWETCPF